MVEKSHRLVWSAQAAEAFELCPRKYYWSAYGRAGEWRRLLNRRELTQRVVRDAANWLLVKWRAGGSPTAAIAYDEIVRATLNNTWTASRSGAWRQSGKHVLGLHELHFPDLHTDLPPDWPQFFKRDIITMLEYFVDHVCPQLMGVATEDRVQTPKSFVWEDEYAVVRLEPDFVYEMDGVLKIHVWDTEEPSSDHLRRVAVLMWWACQVLERSPESVHVQIEFLRSQQSVGEIGSVELVEQARSMMVESMMDISDYLEQADRPGNRPLPKEEWDTTPDRSVCALCRYYALCEPEFEELGC